MRVLVSGDRDWTDDRMVYGALDALYRSLEGEFMVVVHGCARGADSMAGNWALDRKRRGWNVDVEEYPAHWRHGKHCPERCKKPIGRPAGPVRNRQMLKEGRPDLVVAFHDSITNSKGTKDMLEIAEKAGTERWLLGHVDRLYDGGQDDGP